MIVFTLVCSNDHAFEAWFPSGDAYDAQARDRVIACPICGDREIRKAPMAPRIARHRGMDAPRDAVPQDDGQRAPSGAADAAVPAPTAAGPALPSGPAAEAWRRLAALCRRVEAVTDDVGPRFAEEARRIHYGEVDARSIRGETSEQEAEALADEGIAFGRLPWIPSDRQ